jgi:hypothetical protein
MKPGFSDEDIAVMYEDVIEDMVAEIDGAKLHPADVTEFSEIIMAVNAERERQGRELIALPPSLHRALNECAKRGMLKGQGRGRPRDSLVEAKFKHMALNHAAEYACERKKNVWKRLVRYLRRRIALTAWENARS